MIKHLSLSQQSALNIAGSVIVVAVNTIINFVLSPFIVSHLGVSANGYITLANNFVSYIALITIALNSMCGRFILVEYRRNNMKTACEYYSSVLFGDWIICGILLLPMLFFIIWIDRFINISPGDIADTRILFSLIFANYLLHLCLPQWLTAEYCTNNLYLRSIRNICAAIARAIAIFLLYKCLTPHSYYVAVAACIMSTVSLSMDYWFYRMLMPELKIRLAYFKWDKIKALISSGIWNSISSCGNILLEGLDILVANLFISPVAAGIMALSKIVPNMINQLSGTMATTFGPRITYLYADGNKDGMVREICNNIHLIALLSNIPIGIFIIFGQRFFELWIPSEDSFTLTWLAICSLIGIIFTGLSQCMINVFIAVNRLKWNSLFVVFSGIVNVTCVYLCLKFTSWGIFSIVASSSAVSILRIFLFTAPYSAYCIKVPLMSFVPSVLKGIANIIIPLAISYALSLLYVPVSLTALILLMIVCGVVILPADYVFALNSEQKQIVRHLVNR